MQPYFAPYLGYFQLVQAVHCFVFYDDVNFIKGGWINRNFIIINGQTSRFTVPLNAASPNRKINEIEVLWNNRATGKWIKTMNQALAKKPKATEIFNEILEMKPRTIADLAIASIELCCSALVSPPKFRRSSELNRSHSGDKTTDLIEICRIMEAAEYINPIGGRDLYSVDDFASHGVQLHFLQGTPSTSILDIIDEIDLDQRVQNYQLI